MQSLAVSNDARYVDIILKDGKFRGIGAVFIGAIPAHALYFSAYESIKKSLGNGQLYQNFVVNGKFK